MTSPVVFPVDEEWLEVARREIPRLRDAIYDARTECGRLSFQALHDQLAHLLIAHETREYLLTFPEFK